MGREDQVAPGATTSEQTAEAIKQRQKIGVIEKTEQQLSKPQDLKNDPKLSAPPMSDKALTFIKDHAKEFSEAAARGGASVTALAEQYHFKFGKEGEISAAVYNEIRLHSNFFEALHLYNWMEIRGERYFKTKERQEQSLCMQDYQATNGKLRNLGYGMSDSEALSHLIDIGTQQTGLSRADLLKQYGADLAKDALNAGFSAQSVVIFSLAADKAVETQLTAQLALVNMEFARQFMKMIDDYIKNEDMDAKAKKELEKKLDALVSAEIGQTILKEESKKFEQQVDKLDKILTTGAEIPLGTAVLWHNQLDSVRLTKNPILKK